ncbi:MAG: CotH kinase family protein, partial [Acidimicrobiales bacterium]
MSPEQAVAGEPVTLTATIVGPAAAELVYLVGFGVEQRLPMTADGQSFSATIPGQSAGELVRYRIETGPGSPTIPSAASGYRFEGYVVESPGLDTEIDRIQWFIDQADYDEMLGGSRFDRDRLFPAVIAYGGKVYDGTQVQVRGGDYGRTNYPKQSFNVELANGRLLDAPELFDYPVDEFAMQSEWVDWTKGRAHTSWFVFEQEGFDRVSSHFAYVERNGNFDGLYRIGEKLDGVWRDVHGWGDSNFYKADGGWDVQPGFEQKEGDADPILDTVRAILDQPASTRNAALYDVFDVPNMVNYIALTLLIDHNDQDSHNYYVGHDLAGTGRVSYHPWDLDWTWRKGIVSCKDIVMTEPGCIGDPVFDAFWAIPEFQNLVYRRIRSILDTTLVLGNLESRHREVMAAIGDEVAQMELDLWGGFLATSRITELEQGIAFRRNLFNDLPAVPSSQVASVPVVISEIHYSPADGGPELLELANPGSTSVDMSGWSIDGVGLTVPFGTVIPAGGRIVFTDDDRAFRAAHPGLGVIVVEYPGGLKGAGETITVFDRQGREVDVVTYSDQAPWPTEPANGLVTLELTDLALDNNDPASWAPSTVTGGTPGRGPDNEAPPVTVGQVTIRAKGETGSERIELRYGSTVLAGYTLTTEFADYTTEVGPGLVDGLTVNFVNNAIVDGKDRNVFVDYLEVDGQRVQAEDPAIPSQGHYANGSCGYGLKQTEKLHCNGYFDFSGRFAATTPPPVDPPPVDPPPGTGDDTITVRAAGLVGGEII